MAPDLIGPDFEDLEGAAYGAGSNCILLFADLGGRLMVPDLFGPCFADLEGTAHGAGSY